MITQLKIVNIATFSDAAKATVVPRKINFCYGSNGSGKTTISNVIAAYKENPNMVTWSGLPMQTLVYNKEFVEANFGETGKIGGIFTLGKDSKDVKDFITAQRAEVEKCLYLISSLEASKEKLISEQKIRETNIDDSCWSIKDKYDDDFPEAFSGFNRSKNKFRLKCLEEAKLLEQPLPPVDEMKRLYGLAFGATRPTYDPHALINILEMVSLEKCDLLADKISGSADTPIGKFIEYLGNGDWLKIGITFAEKADGKCPFCQQELPGKLFEDIKAFFDDSYERDLERLKSFHSVYYQKTNEIITQLRDYANLSLPILDYTLFRTEVESLSRLIEKNNKIIDEKLGSPSADVKIESLQTSLEKINGIVAEFNRQIKESNDFVKNQKSKQGECVKYVWQLVVAELKAIITTYSQETKNNKDGTSAIEDKLRFQNEKKRDYLQLVAEKESTVTSVRPTVNAINAILTRFGFEGFSIIENPSEIGTYKIVRSDGQCVEKTLSEGEYNFITFLYFYHLVYGSKEKSGVALPKVVVIDDPISSLDSNVLFIVSTLTKQLIDDCRKNKEGIKQVFALTHNVYFHKEISYLGSRKSWKKEEVAFWIIKKCGNVSHIVGHGSTNPISTSYELLWSELKDINGLHRITIFNTLRRILEYYFNIMGGLDYVACINKFEGEDKLLCRSLISCVNEGSHFITDDFVMQYESEAIDKYIQVFKLIFERMGHISHYNMMLGIITEFEEAEEQTQHG